MTETLIAFIAEYKGFAGILLIGYIFYKVRWNESGVSTGLNLSNYVQLEELRSIHERNKLDGLTVDFNPLLKKVIEKYGRERVQWGHIFWIYECITNEDIDTTDIPEF